MAGAPQVSQWGLDPLFFSHLKLAIRELVGGEDVMGPRAGRERSGAPVSGKAGSAV